MRHQIRESFVVALMESIASATVEFMIREPDAAETHCTAGFDAMWRAIA